MELTKRLFVYKAALYRGQSQDNNISYSVLIIRTNTTDIPQRLASGSILSQSDWRWGHRTDTKSPLGSKLVQIPIEIFNMMTVKYHILRPKTSALAALIKKGSCAPPAPKAFMAFHNPGAVNPTPPIIQALKSVPRYHTRFSIGVSDNAEIEARSAIMAFSWVV